MNKSREVPVRIVVRKKKGAHPHHGGAWKVAFADFMTAMFAMFLVLWLVNQSSDVKSSIAGYFQDPLGGPTSTAVRSCPGRGPSRPRSGRSPSPRCSTSARTGSSSWANR